MDRSADHGADLLARLERMLAEGRAAGEQPRDFAALADELAHLAQAARLQSGEALRGGTLSLKLHETRELPLPDEAADSPSGEPPVGPHAATLSFHRAAASIDNDRAAAERSGPQLPGYEILKEIARGGMGVVYKARQASLNRIVAVKMILAGQFAGEADVARFVAEAESAAGLRHPNIVAIHEIGRAGPRGDQHFFSMDFIEGESLADRARRQPYSARQAAELLETICAAIHYAHEQGILHRDLKPANILLDAAGRPHVSDFGLAKRLEGGSNFTATGLIVGTPSYMPPEQASGQTNRRRGDLGRAGDIYSLGAVLYELLTGRPPFQAESPLDTVLQVLHDEPIPPRRLRPKVPRDLETICLKCLHKDPKRRYASAAELAADLRSLLDGKPITARPAGWLERAAKWSRRRPAWAAVIAVSVLAVAATLAVFIWKNEDLQEALGLARQRGELAQRRFEDARRHNYALSMRRTDEFLRSERTNVAGAIDLLKQQIPESDQEDLRGFEWHYLAAQCRAYLNQVASEALYLQFRPDGELVTFSLNTLQRWKGQTLLGEHRVLDPEGVTLRAAAFSADGSLLAFAKSTGEVGWLNVDQPQRIVLRKHGHQEAQGAYCTVGVSDDGSLVATGAGDGTVKLWDTTTNETPRELTGLPGEIVALEFSPGLRNLAVGGANGELHVVDLAGGKSLRLVGYLDEVAAIAFSPSGGSLAAADAHGTLIQWDVEKQRKLRTLQLGSLGPVPRGLEFSHDGRWMAICTRDSNILLHSSENLESRVYRGHTDRVVAAAFHPTRDVLASASWDNTVKFWDASQDQRFVELAQMQALLECVRYSPDGKLLVYGGADVADDTTGEVVLFDTAAGQARHTLRGVPMAFCDFSPDGRTLLIGGARQHYGKRPPHVELYDVESGQSRQRIEVPEADIYQGVFLDAHTLALGCRGGAIYLWDLAGKRIADKLITEDINDDVVGLVLTGHDGLLVARYGNAMLRVWSLAERRLLQSRASNNVNALAASPRGDLLALPALDSVYSAEPDQRAMLAALESGVVDRRERHIDLVNPWTLKTERVLSGHNQDVVCVTFSPDGRRVATGSRDCSIKIWDTHTGHELLTLTTGRIDAIRGLAFAPDGRELAAISAAGVVRVWQARGAPLE